MIDEYVNDPNLMKRLDAISRKRTGDPDAAQELTQETLCAMLETNYKHIGQFLHEFRRISLNVWKREKCRQAKTVDIEIDNITAEAEVDVDQVIDRLPQPEQKIARLSYRGYTRKEITKTCHISERDLSVYRNQIRVSVEAML